MMKRFIAFFYILCFALAPVFYAYPADIDFVKFESAKENFRKGVVYFNNMQYLAAAEFFKKAIDIYPDYYTARDYLARSYKLAGFSDNAIVELKKIIDIYPDNIAAKTRLESLLFRKGSSDSGDEISEYVFHSEYDSAVMKSFSFPAPTDLAVDNERNIYVTSFSSPRVVKIDLNGKAQEVIRSGYSGGIYGIEFKGSKLFFTDFKNDTVFIASTEGKILNKFGGRGSGDGLFHGPKGIAVDNRGYIYVVDSGNCRIQKFDPEGRFNLAFGKQGEYEGDFKNPSDITVLNEQIFISDTNLKKIAVYDQYGNYIKDLPIPEHILPRGISSFKNFIVISDEKAGLIFYDPATEEKHIYKEWDGHSITRPFTFIADPDGFFYVADYAFSKILCFSPSKRRYSNIEVEVTSADTSDFPVVAFYVNIRGRDGKPVYGLKSENFKLTEDNAPVTKVYSDYLKNRVKSVAFTLLVDRSLEMQPYHGDLPWVADFILKSMRTNDKIQLINFNNQVWVGNNFDWSRRRTLSSISQRDYGNGKKTGEALYQAISSLLARNDRRAVVLITDGKVAGDSFVQYTPDIIIDYAKEHYIPIFIVSLKNPDPIFQRIATETGGSLLRPSDIDGLKNIYPIVKESQEYRYVLVFQTYKMPSFKGWWVDVKFEVDYKGQKGVQWGGYFVP